MFTNRNLIVALIALWCYARNCNINLANNTSIILILYALLSRGYINTACGNGYTPRLFKNTNPCNWSNMQSCNTQFNNKSFAFPFNAPLQASQCQCPLF